MFAILATVYLLSRAYTEKKLHFFGYAFWRTDNLKDYVKVDSNI